ncbi:MAG: aminoacylase, partial [Dehalococcoidia bacterium]
PFRSSRRTQETGGGLPTWESYGGYLDAIASHPPALNVATLVGFGTMRAGALGGASPAFGSTPAGAIPGANVDRPATAEEVARMQAWLREGLEAGAVGMSTGLIYEPDRYATTEEIAEVAAPLAEFGALYASHVRGEGATLLNAHAEAMEIGRRVGVPVQISHHKASGRGFWGRVRDSIAQIEEARDRGEDVTADQYPYTAGSTRLAALLLNGRIGAREGGEGLRGEDILLASVPGQPDWEGRSVADLADEWDLPQEQAAQRVVEEGGTATIVVQFAMDEADVRTVLAHETTMIGTDGLGFGSRPHPRHYGTYPRILGKYVREEGVITLEDAIWKMSGFPATKFHLAGRGFVREGHIADLVLFDPATVIDTATYEDSRRTPAGMPWVFVNGVAAVREGAHTGARAGRPVRRDVDA